MTTTPPLAVVEWEDAKVIDDDTWVDSSGPTVYKPQFFVQVGFVLHDGKDGVILTAAWSPEMMAARDQIPRAMIRKITYLKRGKA